MACITCAALNDRLLCNHCCNKRANAIVSALASNGTTHNLNGTKHAEQIAKAAVDLGAEEVNQLVLRHKYARSFDVPGTTNHISCADMNSQHALYVKSHCTKYNFWYHAPSKTFIRITPLRLFNQQSIVDKLMADPAKGIKISDIVKEYDSAYLDLHKLIHKKVVVARKDIVWLNPT